MRTFRFVFQGTGAAHIGKYMCVKNSVQIQRLVACCIQLRVIGHQEYLVALGAEYKIHLTLHITT